MPAQQGLRVDDEEGLPPQAHAAGQEHQECPVPRGAAWPLHTPAQNDDLLTQQRILCDEGGLATHEVGQGPADQRRGCR